MKVYATEYDAEVYQVKLTIINFKFIPLKLLKKRIKYKINPILDMDVMQI